MDANAQFRTTTASIKQSAPRETVFTLYSFEEGRPRLHEGCDIQQLYTLQQKGDLLWLNIEGLANQELISQIAEMFALHPLALEDVSMVQHRAKAERYEHFLFVVLRALIPEGKGDTEQISLFLGEKFFITLQERPSSVVTEVVRRLNQRRHELSFSSDVLAYETIDALLDEYFPAFEHYGEWLEQIEGDLLEGRINYTLANIRALKREILIMRKALWPMREVINMLIHGESELICEKVRLYLRDCHDHVFHLMDLAETYREVTADISDIYVSAVSARLNETMKVLTIISTIFMPLGFIASLYGMNFDTSSPFNMPELHWRYGYLFALGMMFLTVVGMCLFFLKRGWIGRGYKKPELLRGEDYE